MGTAVLRSHDCLKGRLHLDAFRPFPTPPAIPCRKKFNRSPPRSNPKKSPRRTEVSRPGRRVSFAGDDATVLKLPSRNLVMEEVTILKRGEELNLSDVHRQSDSEDVSLCSTERIGPDPETVPRQIRFSGSLSEYAGPGFSSSPPPSSLPFPALLVKTRDDLATRELRCLLRLDGLP